MYVVELLGVSPFSLDIVNFEPDVRRYPVIVKTLAPPLDLDYSDIPARLNGAQIVSKNLRRENQRFRGLAQCQ